LCCFREGVWTEWSLQHWRLECQQANSHLEVNNQSFFFSFILINTRSHSLLDRDSAHLSQLTRSLTYINSQYQASPFIFRSCRLFALQDTAMCKSSDEACRKYHHIHTCHLLFLPIRPFSYCWGVSAREFIIINRTSPFSQSARVAASSTTETDTSSDARKTRCLGEPWQWDLKVNAHPSINT
jgi:hypothetical protein